jgi:hypothetical protein
MWLIALLLTHSVLAAAVPPVTDVVLIYEDADLEAQGKDNYLFTVDGDSTIYPCAANRCSLADFVDRPTVALTVYKLPEGYPRVANVIDQATLAEYRAAAAVTYAIPNVATTPAGDGSTSRTFQEIHLSADGNFSVDTVSQERNVLLQAAIVTERSGTWLWYVVGGIGAALAIGIGRWLWKRKF